MGLVGEEFEGFGGLDGGGEVDGGGEDAGGVAGFYGAGWGLGEDAGEAGGGLASGQYVASLPSEQRMRGFFAALRMTTFKIRGWIAGRMFMVAA